jgi:chromosome segregation ATPase
VCEVRGWKLETYDAVRVPSAGTFARPNTENHREASAAYARLVEAGMIKTEEATMTLAELKKNHAALVAELMAELRATVEGEGKLSEAQARCTALETELAQVKTTCTAEAAKVQAKETELKAAQDALTEATAALKTAEAKAKEANDKLAKAEHTDAMAKAVIDAVEATPAAHRKTVEAKLVKWVQEGKATTVEAVKAAGETLAEVADEVAKATAAAATGLVRTEATDDPPSAAPAPAAPAPELTVEAATMAVAINKLRTGLGRE